MRTLWAVLVTLTSAMPALAQGPITPGTPTTSFVPTGTYKLEWNAATPGSVAAGDAVVGYELVSFRDITGGVQVRTWGIGNVTTFSVPGSELGATAQVLSLRAISASGLKSNFSNSIPLTPALAPVGPTNLRIAP